MKERGVGGGEVTGGLSLNGREVTGGSLTVVGRGEASKLRTGGVEQSFGPLVEGSYCQ